MTFHNERMACKVDDVKVECQGELSRLIVTRVVDESRKLVDDGWVSGSDEVSLLYFNLKYMALCVPQNGSAEAGTLFRKAMAIVTLRYWGR